MIKNGPPWTHIILEAYCTRKLSSKKDKQVYELIETKTSKFKKKSNLNYDTNYKTPKKPSYCPNIPQYKCLEKECPYFAYTNAEKKDYLSLNKRYKTKK